jgi:hypothetical protein
MLSVLIDKSFNWPSLTVYIIILEYELKFRTTQNWGKYYCSYLTSYAHNWSCVKQNYSITNVE